MRIKAWDWFKIAGYGTVVNVDVSGSDGVGCGDEVQFELMPSSPGRDGLISEVEIYLVTGVEESRCLVAHEGRGQCVTGRALRVCPGRLANAPAEV